MNDEKNVSEVVTAFFVDELGVDEEKLEPDFPLFSSGMLVSIDFIMTVTFAEEEFAITIPDELKEADKMNTINQIVEIIENLKNG